MKEIDLDSVFKKKNPRLYRFMPKFVLSFLKRLIHQEELNDFIRRDGNTTGNDFTSKALEALDITYKVEFEDDTIDKKGRYILASNHPLGGPDGIMLIDYFSRYFDKVIFPVNDILMEVENVKEFFVPINKHGGQSRESARLMDEAFASDSQILLFPAGLVSRKKKGKIKDLQWKKNFITKAIQHDRDIIPVHISGRNSHFFYNLANLRAFFNIKTNLEMLLLPNELFKQKGRNFTIKVGKPIKNSIFDKTRKPNEWASFVKKKVYEL